MTIFFMAIAQIGIFQLTSSRRGWPKCWPIHIKWITFQLTSSRRGWPNRKQSSFASKNFNSHPHEEDDLLQHFFRLPTISFQLTSSRRGWQVCIVLLSLPGHFNSHPHEEDDEDMVNMWIWITSISTHILTKRMTVYHAFWIPRCIFQLTSSRRGWLLNPYYQALGINISTHILTKRMTDSLFCQDFFVFYFNSHPHEEDDNISCFVRWLREYFNSHPHEEDDEIFTAMMSYSQGISTHILTKRMTGTMSLLAQLRDISTHILTKRMTSSNSNCTTAPSFQLTSSRRGWRFSRCSVSVCNVFQLTSSRRGWQSIEILFCVMRFISTHILTKRMTISYTLVQMKHRHFNSHPHEEDD